MQTAESPVETINYEENASASSYNSRALLQVEEEEIEEPGSSTREINSVFEVDVDMPLSDFMPATKCPSLTISIWNIAPSGTCSWRRC